MVSPESLKKFLFLLEKSFESSSSDAITKETRHIQAHKLEVKTVLLFSDYMHLLQSTKHTKLGQFIKLNKG